MNGVNLDIGFAHRSVELMRRTHQLLHQLEDDNAPSANDALHTLANDIEAQIKVCDPVTDGITWKVMATSLRALACHFECRNAARTRVAGLAELRQRSAVLLHETRETISGIAIDSARKSLLSALGEGTEITNAKKFIKGLQSLPLPLTYLMKKADFVGPRTMTNPTPTPPEPSIVKVVAFLDGVPLVSPQIVRQDTLYSLKFRVCGEAWPPDATELSLDLLTTCPSGTYEVSRFTLPRPKQLERYEGELAGQMVFKASQSALAENLVFRVRCAFQGENVEHRQVPTMGHNEAQFRVDSADDSLLTSGYRNMDLHVSELLRELVSKCPRAQTELKELVPLLEALVAFLGTCAQGGVLKGVSNLSERDFQRMAIDHLRMRLGQDVQEHPHQAGGITDVRFRGVVTELKVEKTNGDRVVISQNYCPQAAQYQGVEARQVSVALILDLTPKVLPPSDIRNDIRLVDVATHGGTDSSKKYPSKAFVFVVNGNTKDPSSYS